MSSIFSQVVNFEYEIVIAEDCSTDRTKKIRQSLYEGHPKVRVIYTEENLGIRRNYIKVLPLLKGEYYTVLDPDDFWIGENKLQKQVDFMDVNPEFSAICHNTKLLHLDLTEEIMIKKSIDKLK